MNYENLNKKELIALIEELKVSKVDESRDLFISNISHDVRTLLHAIYGNAQILSNNTNLGSQEKKSVKRILDASSHMVDLMNDIINISTNTGTDKVILSNFSLDEFLENIYAIFTSVARDKGLSLELVNTCDDKIIINSDKNKLFYILLNLIGNAIKYTKKGSVTLSCKQIGEEILFEIIDTGIGIKKEMISEITKNYIRAHEKQNIDGTGLGLGIASKNIKLLGSVLEIESKVEKGSCFSFHIKCAKNNKMFVSTQDDIFNMKEIESPKRPDKFDILLYAKNDDEKNILGTYFSSRNIKYDYLEELELISSKLSAKKYNMVFIDANKLNNDEISILKIAQRSSKTPLIALTSLVMSNDLFKLNQLFTNYIIEPYSFVDMDQALIMFSNEEFFYKQIEEDVINEKIIINNKIKHDIIIQANIGNYKLCQDLILEIEDEASKKTLNEYLENYDFDKIITVLNQKVNNESI